MKQQQIEEIVMQLVVKSGDARSIAMDVIDLAKQEKFEEAKARLEEARTFISEAHDIQTGMITSEISGEEVPMSLLMCHAQDHLMTAMVVIDLAEKFIDVYEKVK